MCDKCKCGLTKAASVMSAAELAAVASSPTPRFTGTVPVHLCFQADGERCLGRQVSMTRAENARLRAVVELVEKCRLLGTLASEPDSDVGLVAIGVHPEFAATFERLCEAAEKAKESEGD